MKIFVTGGAGYKGSYLVNELLSLGNKVTVCDTFWFGDFLGEHKNLKKIKIDINHLNENHLKNHDAVIHLASIANDPSSLLNSKLSWETIVLGTYKLCSLTAKLGIKKFIYASSGSVYGFKRDKKVTEQSSLEPISDYNKCKMSAERIIMSFQNDFAYTIIRPATVCGLSPRMRLDVSVNMFVYQAFKNKQITVFGGKQIRPNIHIQDISSTYLFFLEKEIPGIFNAGFENLSIDSIAKRAKKSFPNTKIIHTKSNDPRSYRLNSDKLLNIGFKSKKKVKDAIDEISEFFISKKFISKSYMSTVKHMKKLKL